MTARLLHERVREELTKHTSEAYASVLRDPTYEAVGLVGEDGSITAVVLFHEAGLVLPWANTGDELGVLLEFVEPRVRAPCLTAIVTDEHSDELVALGFERVAHTSGGHPVLQRGIGHDEQAGDLHEEDGE